MSVRLRRLVIVIWAERHHAWLVSASSTEEVFDYVRLHQWAFVLVFYIVSIRIDIFGLGKPISDSLHAHHFCFLHRPDIAANIFYQQVLLPDGTFVVLGLHSLCTVETLVGIIYEKCLQSLEPRFFLII